MKIMAYWINLDELKGGNKKWEYIDSKDRHVIKSFMYQKLFRLYFHYHHLVENYNNCKYDPIPFDSSWATKFWMKRKFSWYLAVPEANENLS